MKNEKEKNIFMIKIGTEARAGSPRKNQESWSSCFALQVDQK